MCRLRRFFGEYACFSSFSTSWLDHARRFAERMIQELSLGPSHRVVEVGSNDGYLLQYFLARNIPVLGIDAIQRSSCPANGILLRRPCPGSMLTPATGWSSFAFGARPAFARSISAARLK